MRPGAVGLLLLCGLTAAPARASLLDLYGFNPRGVAMGNAQVAAVDDYTGAFYNPGALARPKRLGFGVGFVAGFPALQIRRKPVGPEQQASPSELPESFTGLNLGALFPLLGDRAAVAVALHLPTLRVARGQALDTRTPYFYRYQSLHDKFVALVAGAVEVTDWLSVGGGVQMLAGLDGVLDVRLDPANRRIERRRVEVDIFPTVAPTAGVHLRPIDRLQIGASWRDDLELTYSLPGVVAIDELIDLNLNIGGTFLYTPAVFNLGAAYEVPALRLLVCGEADFVRWSQAPDPSPRIRLSLAGPLAEGLGLGEALDVAPEPPAPLGFEDVWVLRLGLEHAIDPIWRVRGGYTWRPSPAPVPIGALNYIDNDAHVFAVGGGATLPDPLEVQRRPLSIDLAVQLHWLVEQAVVKRAGPADPTGDYAAGGAVYAITLSLRQAL